MRTRFACALGSFVQFLLARALVCMLEVCSSLSVSPVSLCLAPLSPALSLLLLFLFLSFCSFSFSHSLSHSLAFSHSCSRFLVFALSLYLPPSFRLTNLQPPPLPPNPPPAVLQMSTPFAQAPATAAPGQVRDRHGNAWRNSFHSRPLGMQESGKRLGRAPSTRSPLAMQDSGRVALQALLANQKMHIQGSFHEPNESL